MLRVVSHERPIAFTRTSSDCVFVSRMFRSITPSRMASSARDDSSIVVTSRIKKIVDQIDLIVGILIGSDQEKIGEVAQHG